jgi:hypothetical protein
MEQAQRKLVRVKPRAILYRGISKFFSIPGITLDAYRPGARPTFKGFTSGSTDLRIGAKFMFGDQAAEAAEGVIFKIRARTAGPIEWCSFVPEESEALWPPDIQWRVVGWYTASEANLRHGQELKPEGAFLIDHEPFVQPVPLETDVDDDELERLLNDQKRLIMVELEEAEQW